jgi:excalibur calcium-binding domain-containing protein
MKKVLLALLLGAAGMYFYEHRARPLAASPAPAGPRPELSAPAPPPLADRTEPASAQFQCDGRERCPEMHSCEEAQYFLRHCPNVKMDGDNDGVPCEDQWCSHLR